MNNINAAMWIINNNGWGQWVTQNQVYKVQFCHFIVYFSLLWPEIQRSEEPDCCVSELRCFNYELSARQYVHTHTHTYRLHMICLQWSECLMIFGLFVEEEVQAVCRLTSFKIRPWDSTFHMFFHIMKCAAKQTKANQPCHVKV